MKRKKKINSRIIILALPIVSIIIFYGDKLLLKLEIIKYSLIDRLPWWVVLILLLPIVFIYAISSVLDEDFEKISKKNKSR